MAVLDIAALPSRLGARMFITMHMEVRLYGTSRDIHSNPGQSVAIPDSLWQSWTPPIRDKPGLPLEFCCAGDDSLTF